MDFCQRLEILQRLQREREMLLAMIDVMQKDFDRNTCLGLKEVSAFESGVIYARQYNIDVLDRLITLINGSDDSEDA